MSQLLAVFASTIRGGADWAAGAIPVEVTNAYDNWPDLRDSSFSAPLPFFVETPQYLWHVPVADPKHFVQQTFTRTIKSSGQNNFNATELPAGDYRMVITHAADDLYVLNVFADNNLIYPSPVQNELTRPPWKNVKAVEFEFSIRTGETVQIQSIVTNLPPIGKYNPAMFTWLAKVYS